MRAIDEGGEREDGGEQREKCERKSRGEVGSNVIYAWRFQREAEAWGGEGGWTEGAGVPLSDPLTKGRVGLWCC